MLSRRRDDYKHFYLIPTYMLLDNALTMLAIPLGAKERNPIMQALYSVHPALFCMIYGIIAISFFIGIHIIIKDGGFEEMFKKKFNKICFYFVLYIEALSIVLNSLWMFFH